MQPSSPPQAAVDAIVGMRQFSVAFEGQQNHAGSTAMVDRADAAMAAFSFVTALDQAFRQAVGEGSDAVWTVGQLELHPGAASIIPGPPPPPDPLETFVSVLFRAV